MKISITQFVHLAMFMQILSTSLISAQGSLTPPPGPPAPAMKSLAQVEPRVAVESLTGITSACLYLIDKPGAYYLTGNIHGVRGASGIEVTTSSVTIDLNGFVLIGVPGSKSGILVEEAAQITVRNGVVRDWGEDGILIDAQTAIVENIIAEKNGGFGLDLGLDNLVHHCQANSNAGGGIFVEDVSTIEDCVADTNSGNGIQAFGSAGLVRHCALSNNQGDGINLSGNGWLVSENSVVGNKSAGIRVPTGCEITNNVLRGNGTQSIGGNGAGIFLVGENNLVQGNHLSENNYGIYAANATGETVIRNVVIHSLSGSANNYVDSGNKNSTTFGPIITATTGTGSGNPLANISLP